MSYYRYEGGGIMNSSLERLNAKENFNYSNTQRIKNIFYLWQLYLF